jgi:selenocysteine lyase/cysteine desulfurase
MLACQRDLFEIPEDVVYLNCAYMSPFLRSVRETGEKAVARKSQPWNIHAYDFFEEAETLRHLFAQLIGADADGIALVPAASYGISVAAANLPLEKQQRIVLLDDQFPSNVYQWQEVASRSGAIVETIERPQDGDWTRAVLQHIDDQTRIVAIPNCHWTDGSIVDLQRVGVRTRAVGAALVVDATQSLGAYPLNVTDVQPDFLVSAAYKWLLGPYSLGFLYVAPRHRQGTPIEFPWINREGSEDFAQLVNYRSTFQPGARRFDVGERSNFILLPMAIVALQQILQWGVPMIDITLRELTTQIEHEAMNLGLQTAAAHYRVGHMIGLRHPSGLPVHLAEELTKKNVFVSIRGQSIRVSPYLYNTLEDIDQLFRVLASLMPTSNGRR